MGRLSSLASDTVIYGVSNVLSRSLGWLLSPYLVAVVSESTIGMHTKVYSIIAPLLVLACLGIETGYYRFVTKDNKEKLFDTLLLCLASFGGLLVLFMNAAQPMLSPLFGFPEENWLIMLLVSLIICADAVTSLYFADLRFSGKGINYAGINLLKVIVQVAFTLFFMHILRYADFLGFSSFGDLEYLLLANFIATLVPYIFFLPNYFRREHEYDKELLRTVVMYSLPLMVMGFFGTLNQHIEKILFTHLDQSDCPDAALGIYGTNFKIGTLMLIFTNSFRMAFDPFLFKQYKKDSSDTSVYAMSMKYFYIFGLFIFLCVMLCLPLWTYYLVDIQDKPQFVDGIGIIPVVLLSELLFGVYYNLSIWYKVTDKTYYGLIFSTIGLFVNVVMNCVLIPYYSYYGAALSAMCSYFVMLVLSLLLGKRHYPIDYPVKKLISLTFVTIFIVTAVQYLSENLYAVHWIFWSFLGLISFAVVIYISEKEDIKKLLSHVKSKH